MSCFSQFIQREEVGDGAAVAAGEQRAAVHSPAGVCGQHRALEEAVLSLQGGERPAEGQGSRTWHSRAALQSDAPTMALSWGSLQLLAGCAGRWGCLGKRGGWGVEAAAPLCTQWAGRGQRTATSCEVPYFGIWEISCQQGLLSGRKNQKGSNSGAAVAYPFQSSLKYCQTWMSRGQGCGLVIHRNPAACRGMRV